MLKFQHTAGEISKKRPKHLCCPLVRAHSSAIRLPRWESRWVESISAWSIWNSAIHLAESSSAECRCLLVFPFLKPRTPTGRGAAYPWTLALAFLSTQSQMLACSSSSARSFVAFSLKPELWRDFRNHWVLQWRLSRPLPLDRWITSTHLENTQSPALHTSIL